MEAAQIENSRNAVRNFGKILIVVFTVMAFFCAFNVLAYLFAAFKSSASEEVQDWYLFVPGTLEWAAFLIAALTCISAAHKITIGASLFVPTVSKRLMGSTIFLWIYVLVNAFWLPLLQHFGTLIDCSEVAISIAENGFTAGIYFDIGTALAATILMLVASIIRYGSALQEQADELF